MCDHNFGSREQHNDEQVSIICAMYIIISVPTCVSYLYTCEHTYAWKCIHLYAYKFMWKSHGCGNDFNCNDCLGLYRKAKKSIYTCTHLSYSTCKRDLGLYC